MIFYLCLTACQFTTAFRSVSYRLKGDQKVLKSCHRLKSNIDDKFSPVVIKSENTKMIITTATLVSLLTTALPLVANAGEASLEMSNLAGPIIDIFIYSMNFLFVCRTVMSWYPKTDLKVLPYSAIVWPTEPLLSPVRELVPPAFGVDVSAIVWIGLLSLLHEILTGQQGIITLLENS